MGILVTKLVWPRQLLHHSCLSSDHRSAVERFLAFWPKEMSSIWSERSEVLLVARLHLSLRPTNSNAYRFFFFGLGEDFFRGWVFFLPVFGFALFFAVFSGFIRPPTSMAGTSPANQPRMPSCF